MEMKTGLIFLNTRNYRHGKCTKRGTTQCDMQESQQQLSMYRQFETYSENKKQEK